MSYDIIQRSRDSEFIELSYCKNIDVDSHKEYSIDDSLQKQFENKTTQSQTVSSENGEERIAVPDLAFIGLSTVLQNLYMCDLPHCCFSQVFSLQPRCSLLRIAGP